MPSFMTQEDIYNEFIAACNKESAGCQHAIQIYSEKLVDEDLFSKDSVYKIAEASFLQIYCNWEQFLENSFVGYMLGYKSRSGKEVITYTTPNDADHARNILKSTNRFLEWGDSEKILIYANNVFESGGPYNQLSTMKSELNAIKKTRNYIAHNSESAKSDFNNVVRSTVGHLPIGITAGGYLLDYQNAHDKRHSFFEHYLNYLEDSADLLTS